MAVLLSAASILAANDLKTVDEPVPEWPNADGSPGIIRLRELTAEASLTLTKRMEAGEGDDGMFIIIAMSAIDAEGNLLFTEEDIKALKKKNLHVLNRLQRICLRMNNPGAAVLKNVLGEAVTDASPTS